MQKSAKLSVGRPDDVDIRYGHTANLAQRNVETFIHNVAPNVNAHLAAEAVLLEAG